MLLRCLLNIPSRATRPRPRGHGGKEGGEGQPPLTLALIEFVSKSKLFGESRGAARVWARHGLQDIRHTPHQHQL